MACPHSLGGHCTEWWPGGGQSHSQPCLGARRAAKVAPAVAGDRSPQSPLCSHGICEHAQLGLSAQGGDEPSAMLTCGACACNHHCHHLQPAPLPEQEDGVKFVLL